MADNFMDDKYEVPQKGSNYMKFEKGKNRFRMLSLGILGYEGWKEEKDETGKKVNRPVRVPMDEAINVDDVDDESKIKHFWAMPVANRKDNTIQILEITQKGIQKSIKSLTQSPDWGSPLNYDIEVTKTGDGMDTEYSVNPTPKKKIDEDIAKEFKGMNINLNALYTGDDPFAESDKNNFVDKVSEEMEKDET